MKQSDCSIGYPVVRSSAMSRWVIQYLQCRSQRPYQPPPGVTWLEHLTALGLIRLSGSAHT